MARFTLYLGKLVDSFLPVGKILQRLLFDLNEILFSTLENLNHLILSSAGNFKHFSIVPFFYFVII